jgi:hypothetical protein
MPRFARTAFLAAAVALVAGCSETARNPTAPARSEPEEGFRAHGDGHSTVLPDAGPTYQLPNSVTLSPGSCENPPVNGVCENGGFLGGTGRDANCCYH